MCDTSRIEQVGNRGEVAVNMKRIAFRLVVGVCLLLAPCLAVAQDADPGETTIWVPVPVTPGDGRSCTIQPSGELPTYARPDWSGGYKIDPPGELPTYVRPDWSTGTSGELPVPVPGIVIQD